MSIVAVMRGGPLDGQVHQFEDDCWERTFPEVVSPKGWTEADPTRPLIENIRHHVYRRTGDVVGGPRYGGVAHEFAYAPEERP